MIPLYLKLGCCVAIAPFLQTTLHMTVMAPPYIHIFELEGRLILTGILVPPR